MRIMIRNIAFFVLLFCAILTVVMAFWVDPSNISTHRQTLEVIGIAVCLFGATEP